MTDPFDMLHRLGQRLQEDAAELGLTLQTFAALPGFDGHPNMIQAVFVVGEQPAVPDEDQASVDAEFEKLVGSLAESEEDKFRKEIEERIKKSNGGEFL